MSNETNGGSGGGIVVTITMTPTGQLNLSGPLENPLMMYGILEMAKVVLQEHLKRQAEGQRIQPVSLSPGRGFFGK